MTPKQSSPALTAEQKGRIFGILSVGCDRETAANYIGCTSADLNRAMQLDAEFATDVHRTEANSELNHMRTVSKAAEEAKNWRAAVWWLEMHAPDRFKPRSAGEITIPQLQEFISVLTTIFCEEVQNENDRRRVLKRIYESIQELSELVRRASPLSNAVPYSMDSTYPLLALTVDRDDDAESPDEDD